MKEKKYNIYITSYKNRKERTLIGKNLNERQAERRTLAGLSNIDRENYFIEEEEVK
jgi:hypothetical protein